MHAAHAQPPSVSVVIPVRNSPAYLRACLAHLDASAFRDFEVVVVDDASTDDGRTAAVAAEFPGVRLARLNRQSGPSAARNRGVRLAAGRLLVFVDADVCVRPNTLQMIVDTFATDPGIDAVFGSYDRLPSAENMVSRFRNLLHHFVHQHANPTATTFWAGCGAIKHDVFAALGGFSEAYARPCIEDIEFGRRLVDAGFRVRLDRSIQAKHLKKWTFVGMVKTDLRDRGIPWTRLMLERGGVPNDLNLRHSQRVCTLLAFAIVGLAMWWVWRRPATLGLLLGGTLGMFALEHWSARRWMPKWLAVALGWAAVAGGLAGLVILHQPVASIVPAGAMLAGIVLLNSQLYSFLARSQSTFFAGAVLPIHVAYYLVCGVSFGIGVLLHHGWPSARPTVQRLTGGVPPADPGPAGEPLAEAVAATR